MKTIKYWAELLLIPASIMAIFAAIQLVTFLTGRAVVDDPGALVGMLYNAGGIVIAITLTAITQKQLFGYRSERLGDFVPTLWDDVHDSLVTVCLLALFSYLLWH